MQSEKKKPNKKLFLILACVILAIILVLLLVMCGKPAEDPQATQPQITETIAKPADVEAGPVKAILEKPDEVTVEGLKEEYEIGEEVAFTATVTDDYYVISKVKISGEKVEPDADGYYRATVSNRLYIVIETELAYGDAVITIEESNKHITYNGVTMKFVLQNAEETAEETEAEDGEESEKITVSGTVKDGKVTIEKMPVGTWDVEPVPFFGGEIKFEPITIAERENEVTTKRKTGINDSIKSGSVTVSIAGSSVSLSNVSSDKSCVVLLQGQELSGSVWFGMKVQMSAADLNATDYRNIGLNIYKNGSSRIQVLSLGNGRAAVKYDNDHVQELSSGLVDALEAGELLLAVNRTTGGKLEVYAGAFAEDMTKLFTIDKTNMGGATLDQFGLDMKGPLKKASIKSLDSGYSMKAVLPSTSSAKQDATIHVTSSSDSLSFDGVKLTFTLKRDTKVQYTGTVADGKVVLKNVPVGTYEVSAVDFFGGKLTFEDAVIIGAKDETEITHNEGINDTVKSDSVAVDVATSSVSVKDYTVNSSKNILLRDQELTGDIWLGMKMQMSAEDLKATDYRNIGINIYKNGSNRIQLVSLGNGRVAIKYDNDHVKELGSGMVSALEAGELLVAVHRGADGKLEVYAGAYAEDMTKLLTVDETAMGAEDLDQIGLDLQGPMKEAAIQNLESGSSMSSVLAATQVVYQDTNVHITSSSDSLVFDGMKLTFTLKRNTNIRYTETVADGKVVLEDAPVGTYSVSAVDLFGGTLTFEDAVIISGNKDVEISHSEGINDTVMNASVVVDVAASSVSVKDYTVNSSKNILLQGQELTGEVWLGMQVQMSAEDLNATDYRNIGLNIYEGGSNRIQVVSLGNGRAAVKYDNDHVKELSSDLVKALEAGELLLAAHRTEAGVLEVYAGIHSGEMTKLFTVDSPNMGAEALDQFGLDIQGPLAEAAIENLVSGEAMADVLSVSDGANQTVTVQLKGKSSRMSFAGVELTFTLARDPSVKFTATANEDGKIVLTDAPVGVYTVSDLDFFGGELTFADLTLWEGRTEVELVHNQGVNDSVGNAAAQIDVAGSSVTFENSVASTNRSNGYFFLQGQNLTGNQWFGMKVKMDAASLTGNGADFVALCIYENGWNLIQVTGAGTVQYNYNYAITLPAEMRNALTGDGMLLAVNRAADGTLRVYGGATAGRMIQLMEVTGTSDPKPNMGTADLDQFGFMTQGSIPSASIENLVSGTSVDDILSGFALAREDVTFTVQKKNKNSVMSFAGVEFTLTLKDDTSVKHTGTVGADGKLVLKDMLVGTYQVSAVDFLGRELTFSDVQVLLGDTAKVLNYSQGINDNVNNASVTVDVNSSSVSVSNLTGSGYFFLQSQNLTGDVWFAAKVQMSAEDLAVQDYRNLGIYCYTSGADYVQVLNNNGKGVVIKYDNSHVYTLNDEMVTALKAGNLYLAVCRTQGGMLEVYAGTAADQMIKLFVVTPNNKTNAIGQFGVNINGPFVKAGIQNLTYGATAEAALNGFALAKENVTINVKSTSDQMSFAGVELTFTLKSDTSVTYTGTADADGKIAVNGMMLGTYSVSSVDFFGGKLTFPDITVAKGTASAEITHKETVTDTITNGAANIRVDVATSSVIFNNSSVDHRNNGKFYFQNQTALTGDVWFGMKVKMTEETLNAYASANSADNYLGLLIWENPSKPADGWNMIQIETPAGDRGGNVNYNNNHHGVLSADYLNALTGEGLYIAVNRRIENNKTYLKIYVGTSADNMVYLTETSDDKSAAKPNVGQGAIDEFGIITQGSMKDASIENLAIGTSADAVLKGFAYAAEDVTVSIKAKSSRMSFNGVKLTFTNTQDSSITYTATANASGELAVSDMVLGTYSVSSLDFFGGKLTFPDITVAKGTTTAEITHNEAIQDDLKADANTVRVDVATSSVHITNYTGQDRNQGAFYLKDQTLSGDVWFGMRMKLSKTDMTEKDGYPYIAWNSYVGNNWNFVQIQNNNGNGIGAAKYNNNYVTGLPAEQAAALTSDSGLLMLLHRTASGTMDVYLSADTEVTEAEKVFTINATAASGKPALNLGNKTLDNFGFLIRCMTGGSSAPDIKSASIENMTSGTSMAEVLAKF